MASRRSRWAMRCVRSSANCAHTAASTVVGHLRRARGGRASGRRWPRRRARSRSGSAVANATSRGVRTPRSRAASATSASCSTARRSDGERPARRRGRAGWMPAVDPEEQVGAALVGAERLDEQGRPVPAGGEVRAWSRGRRGWPAPAGRAARRRRPGPRRSTAPVGRRDGAPSSTITGRAGGPTGQARRPRCRTRSARRAGG